MASNNRELDFFFFFSWTVLKFEYTTVALRQGQQILHKPGLERNVGLLFVENMLLEN